MFFPLNYYLQKLTYASKPSRQFTLNHGAALQSLQKSNKTSNLSVFSSHAECCGVSNPVILDIPVCNTVFMVEKHFQKPFLAFCFEIAYFIYDLDNYEEFARTEAVLSYDLLFNLNENL